MLTVLSLGAGVQSSTLALMAARGVIGPKPDAAIFADTMAEPQSVYHWLDWLETQLPFPVYRVSAGDLSKESLTFKTPKEGEPYIRNVVPAYTLDPDGNRGMLLRKCTGDFKIAPIVRKVRELLGSDYTPGRVCVEQWLGISLDEIQRMKDAPQKYIRHRWPLIEMRFTRLQCLEWLRDNGYNELPPKSACYFCPYHSDDNWRKLKEEESEAFYKAVEFEEKWNEVVLLEKRPTQTRSKIFLHGSCIPLKDIDFSKPPEVQSRFTFMDECEGMCGI